MLSQDKYTSNKLCMYRFTNARAVIKHIAGTVYLSSSCTCVPNEEGLRLKYCHARKIAVTKADLLTKNLL